MLPTAPNTNHADSSDPSCAITPIKLNHSFKTDSPIRRNTVPPSDFELIQDQSRFLGIVDTLREQPRIALDLETNGFFRHPERVCLIQIAIPNGRVFIIDPLALDDMTPLDDVLSDERVEVVLHSGDHDVRSLDRDWGFRVTSLFDTSVAAAFTGMDRLGLGTVLESSLGVSISKDKKLQRSDWTIRPLKPKYLDYAADDVRHLLSLTDNLKRKLSNLGRLEWVAEESERIAAIRYEPPDPDTAVFRVKGSRHLNGRALAVLDSLVAYRERHIARTGRPHFRVIPDAALVSLAANPDSKLKEVRGLGRFARGGLASGLRAAIRKGTEGRPDKASGGQKTPNPHEQGAAGRRLTTPRQPQEMANRAGQIAHPGPSPDMAYDQPQVYRAVSPRPGYQRCVPQAVRRWQRAEFGPSLRSALKR